MFSFSQQSLDQLATCHPDLQKIANEAIKYFDFKVVCGHRGQEDQDKAVAAGNSKTPWPTSKHNAVPSLAMDLYPVSAKYGTILDIDSIIKAIALKNRIDPNNLNTQAKIKGWINGEFCKLSAVVLTIAQQQGIALTWGADWNMDGDTLDSTFIDLPHFELRGVKWP